MDIDDLTAAIRDTMAQHWVLDEYGPVLMIGPGDFATPIARPEVQALVDGIAQRLGLIAPAESGE